MGGQIQNSKAASDTLAAYLGSDKMRQQLVHALPKHLTPDRMIRVVVTTIRQTPALAKCNQMSLIGAVVQAAQLGIEIGNGLGHGYLVPYGKECTLIVGYRGLVDLARRSGQVSTIFATEVREGDGFKYSLGTDPKIEHDPGDRDGEGTITHFYAVCKLKDGGTQFEVMTRAEVDLIRARSRAGKSGPWVTDYGQMGRKTVLRRLCKVLPVSVEVQKLVTLDEVADAGHAQVFDVGDLDLSPLAEASAEPDTTPAEGEQGD